MYRSQTSQRSTSPHACLFNARASGVGIRHIDTWLTADPTPKPMSRRAWRRRRIKSGKT